MAFVPTFALFGAVVNGMLGIYMVGTLCVPVPPLPHMVCHTHIASK